MLKVTHKVRVRFTVGEYVDEVECDVFSLEVCGLLLGSPWQYDPMHARRANTYSFLHDGIHRTLKPLKDDQIKSDVVLVVHKENLHKAKPQPRLAKLQRQEHDARSVSVDIVSAMPIDDKPVVLLGDKPVEVKPLLVEKKDILACGTLPVCVDKGVQTDASCADRVSVQMAKRVEDRSFVRTPLRHFVGAAVCMHKGKDGHVRQLCGPGIAPILQDHTKKVHVQQQRAPSRVEKKKVVAPKSRLMWHQKVVPNVMSSQASQEGSGGVVGRQDLKMAHKCDDVDIAPPFRIDPLVLRTALFEGR
jgi:hypothetical protein